MKKSKSARMRKLYKGKLDPEARAAVEQGLRESAEGKTVYRGAFARYAREKMPPNAAFERVSVRSRGVEDEIRSLEGGAMSAAKFAQLVNGSQKTVRAYRAKGKLFAWPQGRRLRYPVWQVHQGAILSGLADVLTVFAMRDTAPLAIADYFLSESDELDGRRPLDLLRDNRVAEVLEHVNRYGNMGA